MATLTRTLYRSSNGDRWLLARDAESGRVSVRHEANLPSGGRVTDLDVGAFLAAGPPGPQHQELLRLIGTLVMDDEPGLGSEPQREAP
jgi:hypothetical protein